MQKSRSILRGKKSAYIMKKLTSLETRQKIKQLADQGIKSRDIATELGLSIGCVRKWRQRLKKGGQYIQ